MKISFVIPNYNGEDLLKHNLPRVLSVIEKEAEKLGHPVEVVIVDDGSKDKSLDVLKAVVVPKNITLTILKNEKNKGFSPTVNKGVREAKGEVMILLNTDVLPKSGFLSPLLKHFTEEDVFAVGCMDESIENGKTILRGRGIGEWERGFLMHTRGEIDKSDTLWVSGGSGAFRKSLWDALGGFCELYAPFYWEDIDLSYRAQKSGYRVLFEKESIVEHRHETGAIKTNNTERRVRAVAYRNQFFFVWLTVTDASLLVSHLLWLPYHLAAALRSGDKEFLQGFISAIGKIGKVFIERKRNKKHFIVTDHALLKHFTS